MKLLVSLFIFLLAGTAAPAQTKYSSYSNPRFAYSIEYPADSLTPSKIEDGDGAGQIFYSKNKEVEMRVWGEYNALDKSWREWYKTNLEYFGSKPTYTVMKDSWFVISGLKNGKIFYQKTLRRTLKQELHDLDVFYTFTIEYPESQRSKFDTVVKRIAQSFKFDPTADV